VAVLDRHLIGGSNRARRKETEMEMETTQPQGTGEEHAAEPAQDPYAQRPAGSGDVEGSTAYDRTPAPPAEHDEARPY
jgi:hypothetical protein